MEKEIQYLDGAGNVYTYSQFRESMRSRSFRSQLEALTGIASLGEYLEEGYEKQYYREMWAAYKRGKENCETE